MDKRTRLVYGGLLAIWAVIVAWQIVEHDRVTAFAKADLRSRSKEIANTLSAFVRGPLFRGAVLQERLEPVLAELVGGRTNEIIKSGEIISIALLNASGNLLVSAGKPIDLEQREIDKEGERWGNGSVTLVYPVIGASLAPEGSTNPTVILPLRHDSTNNIRDGDRNPSRTETRPNENRSSNTSTAATKVGERDSRRRPDDGPRPPWWARRMEEREYRSLIEKRAVHGLVLAMSTDTVQAASGRDLWIRCIIIALASVSVVGLGMTWSNLARSSELELRLVRAAELNTRLKEMNLAAAGLAHETKNPLNIIRGLAQMLARQSDTTPETRAKSCEIIDETDRVTAQLNEFINFSRPREIRRSAVALDSVVGEVVRALGHDLEEKAIRLQVQNDLPRIEADEQQLRQALFNLLLNATQAVERRGEIHVATQKSGGNSCILEIRDNGPGVPPEHRTDIFKPYFTTNEKGTGLGLAVVQQIIMAHGWVIECLPNEPRGAIFRITHLKVAG